MGERFNRLKVAGRGFRPSISISAFGLPAPTTIAHANTGRRHNSINQTCGTELGRGELVRVH